MSRSGGDNHFVSARERDLRPLLEEGATEFELGPDGVVALEAFLGEAWLSGSRNGHAKLMKQAIRGQRQEPPEEAKPPLELGQLETIEAELRAIMEAAAESLALPMAHTVRLWDLLTRAWTAGIHTYESEVMASLIERNSDVAAEAQRWLDGDGRE